MLMERTQSARAGVPAGSRNMARACRPRLYEPVPGRFMQPDPIGYEDGLNQYGYVGADPVNYRDPTGLSVGYCSGQSGPTEDDNDLDKRIPEIKGCKVKN